MAFQAYKGTRDFYPETMRLRNWISDAWRRVSERNGFEEYDAPILEALDLYTLKSGEEIVEQLFSLTDRGGRSLAMRPEITPSLARMVAAKINTLPRPVKWFSVPRLFRAERPQKGRLREFFQWNVDIIGEDSVAADAECIFTLVDFLREVGLGPGEVYVGIGSRPLAVAALRQAGLPEDHIDTGLGLLDRRAKLPEDVFRQQAIDAGIAEEHLLALQAFQDATDDDSLREAARSLGADPDEWAGWLKPVRQLREILEAMGAWEYCRLDLHVVRGLAYYTGLVYEAFDISGHMRAIAGGGRYDNLLQLVGGPTVGATGFGMGDVVLGLLLQEHGKVPETVLRRGVEFFVIDADDSQRNGALNLVGRLRDMGYGAEYSFRQQNIGKQLKEANRRGAGQAVIVRDGSVAVKHLATGEQGEDIPMEAWLESLRTRPES